jgi:hypothetical protein
MKTANKIRLSLEQGASEFGITRRTLTSRLRTSGILPGDDEKFAIAQLAKAIYGDTERERAALLREQTEIARIKKENLMRQNIPADLVETVWRATIQALKDRIMAAQIPLNVRNDLCRDLAVAGLDAYFAESSTPSADDVEQE